MKRRYAFVVSAILGAALLFGGSAAAAHTEEDISRFVKTMGDKAIAIAAQTPAGPQRQQRLQNHFSDTVDIDWVSRFVLGKHWRGATDAQRQLYKTNYKRFLLKHYTSHFNDYTNESFKILKVRNDGNNEFTAQTEIVRPGRESVMVDYRLRAKGNSIKIFDIIVEGVSLITTQREEFSSVVSRKGLDALINQLATQGPSGASGMEQ